jgi:hypothetical protein
MARGLVPTRVLWQRAAALAAGLLLACVVAPALRAQESAAAGGPLSVPDVLRDPFGYQGGTLTIRGSAGQIGWARVPKAIKANWALVPPGGGNGIAVNGADDPGLGKWVEVRGQLRVDRFEGIPFIDSPEVQVLEELPIWKRPFDRQALMALLALVLPPTGLVLLLTVARVRQRQRPQPTSEVFYRRLGLLMTALPPAPPRSSDEDEGLIGGTLVLTVRSGPDEGRRFRTSSPRVTVGRRPDRDIALTDRLVARFELTLLQREGRIILRPESPHSMVLVNGHPVNEALVAEGDVIRIGATELVVAREQLPAPISLTAEGTGNIDATPATT